MRPLLVALAPAAAHQYPEHLECPQRVESIQASLSRDPELQRAIRFFDAATPLIAEDLEAVHSTEYLENLTTTIGAISSAANVALRDPKDPDGPTYATAASYHSALHAASTAAALVRAVAAGNVPTAAFSACRPPGHHATSNEFMGFCLLNSVAIAARYAQNHLKMPRVAIVDFDVHHGNGTQDIFYADGSVLFIDIHRDGVWPGSGTAAETGEGAGAGATVNVPLPEGAGHCAALSALQRVVTPTLRRFRPDLILISAGFDAHYRDPLECLQYQNGTYHALTEGILGVASEVCGGRCVAVLEGGYDLTAVGEAAAEMARALAGLPSAATIVPPEQMPRPEPTAAVDAALSQVQKLHSLKSSKINL